MKLKTSLILSLVFLFHLAFSQQVKVALIGDYGAASLGPSYEANEAAVADLVKSWDVTSNPLDAILTVGDNNYPDGLQADIETNVGQFYGEYIEGHPDFLGGDNRFIPAIGNHDYGTSDCNLPGTPEPHLNYYNLPGNELYFDYVIGNVHFFVLDSDCHQSAGASIFSEQADWLEATMTNSNAPWKIVYFHHAPYTSGPSDDGTGTLRWDFKDWGATAVIGGHYHYYERLAVDGLAYFVNGAGGTDLHTLNPSIPGSQLQYNEKHGAMQMTFSATEANFKFINVDDQTIDDYTITIDGDCSNQGGDSDGDGICDNQDCQPNNPNFPTLPGTSCDDENENTENDMIQSDGCTCQGTFIQNNDCNEIDGFVKLGEFNNHGYFLADNNAAGWQNAQDQCLALDGYLVSIENQVEKDFIDPFISGEGDGRVFYIGLSRDQDEGFIWTSDGSLFNENNYSASPWEGGNIPSSGNFTTLRKWNPTANVNWGTEGGNAYRRFILEKSCSTSTNDCSNQGGDSDGDGICDNQDCQPNNPNFPTLPGTNCDDENENTENDMIQSDGCTCQGTLIQNNECNEIDGFVKLGEFNNHGYFLADNNAAGWQNAQDQCLALDGYLVSIENQAEKDFIDPFISGEGDGRVFYIGLSRDQDEGFIWTSDGSLFNENNYSASPWEGGNIPSSGNFTTLRKWNPTANVNWGTEGGNAYRRFILEKSCSTSTNDCENQGGDSDGDGICDNQDCQPNNPNFPTLPGTNCDDENKNTENDMIQSDGCTCQGTPILSNSPCDEVTITPSSNSLTIENINVPIAIVKIYDSSWSLVFTCNNNCPSTITETNLSSDVYHIEFYFFDATWGNICSQVIDISLPESLVELNLNNFPLEKNNTFTKIKDEIIIYPNPVDDILFVKNITENNAPLSIQILDSTGKLIRRKAIHFDDGSVVEIPIHDLHLGLFFLILENENGIVEVKRFIKK